MSHRIMTIYGTRPEAIKVAPIIKAIERTEDLENIIVVTGQHREMLDQVNDMFSIAPDHDMNIMAAGQGLNQIAARVISGVDAILELEQPDAVLVQGDTTTVMGAAIAAFNRQVPVIHLEAGLRSGNIDSPFPEEANRRLTAQIAALHLAPTQTGKENLLRESISERDIVVTGNSVIDTLLYAIERLDVRFDDDRLERLRIEKEQGRAPRVLLVTAHRRENLGDAMIGIGQAVADLARKYPDLLVAFPIHKNRRCGTRSSLPLSIWTTCPVGTPPAVCPVHEASQPRGRRPHRLGRGGAGGGAEPRQAGARHEREHRATGSCHRRHSQADRHPSPTPCRRGLPAG